MFPNVARVGRCRSSTPSCSRRVCRAPSRARRRAGWCSRAPPAGTDPGAGPGNGTPAGVGFPARGAARVRRERVGHRHLAGLRSVGSDAGLRPVDRGDAARRQHVPARREQHPAGAAAEHHGDAPGRDHHPRGPVDGFAGDILVGAAGSTKVLTQVRFFVWGHNIKSYKAKRKYGRVEKAPRVRCIAYNNDAAGRQADDDRRSFRPPSAGPPFPPRGIGAERQGARADRGGGRADLPRHPQPGGARRDRRWRSITRSGGARSA